MFLSGFVCQGMDKFDSSQRLAWAPEGIISIIYKRPTTALASKGLRLSAIGTGLLLDR